MKQVQLAYAILLFSNYVCLGQRYAGCYVFQDFLEPTEDQLNLFEELQEGLELETCYEICWKASPDFKQRHVALAPVRYYRNINDSYIGNAFRCFCTNRRDSHKHDRHPLLTDASKCTLKCPGGWENMTCGGMDDLWTYASYYSFEGTDVAKGHFNLSKVVEGKKCLKLEEVKGWLSHLKSVEYTEGFFFISDFDLNGPLFCGDLCYYSLSAPLVGVIGSFCFCAYQMPKDLGRSTTKCTDNCVGEEESKCGGLENEVVSVYEFLPRDRAAGFVKNLGCFELRRIPPNHISNPLNLSHLSHGGWQIVGFPSDAAACPDLCRQMSPVEKGTEAFTFSGLLAGKVCICATDEVESSPLYTNRTAGNPHCLSAFHCIHRENVEDESSCGNFFAIQAYHL